MLHRWIVLITGWECRMLLEQGNFRSWMEEAVVIRRYAIVAKTFSGIHIWTYICGVLCAWNQYEDRWGYENLRGLNMRIILWSGIAVRVGTPKITSRESTSNLTNHLLVSRNNTFGDTVMIGIDDRIK